MPSRLPVINHSPISSSRSIRNSSVDIPSNLNNRTPNLTSPSQEEINSPSHFTANNTPFPSNVRHSTHSTNDENLRNLSTPPISRSALRASLRSSSDESFRTVPDYHAFKHADVQTTDKPEVTELKNQYIEDAARQLFSPNLYARADALKALSHLVDPHTYTEISKIANGGTISMGGRDKKLEELDEHEKNQLINLLQTKQMSEKDRGTWDNTYSQIAQDATSRLNEFSRGIMQLLRHSHAMISAGI